MTEPIIDNIKICGITQTATALLCAELGFGAVGFIFYPKSPRNVSPETVRAITKILPDRMEKVGVFVDEPLKVMLRTAKFSGLTTIQLHGNEGIDTILDLEQHGFGVVKVARSSEEAQRMMTTLPDETSLLLECGSGVLPGGNGAVWNWAEARTISGSLPLGIAGGLSPENIIKAIEDSGAMAYDISSGGESSPGVKDPDAIRRLAKAVQNLRHNLQPFW